MVFLINSTFNNRWRFSLIMGKLTLVHESLCQALFLVRIVKEHLLPWQRFHVTVLLHLVIIYFTIHHDAVSRGWSFIRVVVLVLRAIDVTSTYLKLRLCRTTTGPSLWWLLLSLVLRLVYLTTKYVWTVWSHYLVHGLATCWREHASCRATTSFLLNS